MAGGTFTVPASVRVTAVSGGVITAVSNYYGGQYSVAPTAPYSQGSTSGSGTGATFSGGTFAANWSNLAGVQGAVDYCNIPGVAGSNVTYLAGHGYSATNLAMWTSSAMTFNNMAFTPGNSSGGNYIGSASPAMLFAHMLYVLQNGIGPGARSSQFLQCIQGHLQWVMGANLTGICQTIRLGVRSTTGCLHVDQQKMGVPPPPGIIPFGYTAWAPQGQFMFQGVGVNTDVALVLAADNITGSNETLIQPGSTREWNSWRFGSAYWEFEMQGWGGAVFVVEYTLAGMVSMLAYALYCHGWDGNV